MFQFEHFEKGGFTRFIPKDAKILMLGCGNADFSASLFVSHVFAVEAVLVAHARVFTGPGMTGAPRTLPTSTFRPW